MRNVCHICLFCVYIYMNSIYFHLFASMGFYAHLWTSLVTSGKESSCQCRRQRIHEFDPWVGKIPGRREWQPTPLFLPEKYHEQRSLVGHSPWGHKRVGHNLATKQQPWTFTYLCISLYIRVFISNSNKKTNIA